MLHASMRGHTEAHFLCDPCHIGSGFYKGIYSKFGIESVSVRYCYAKQGHDLKKNVKVYGYEVWTHFFQW